MATVSTDATIIQDITWIRGHIIVSLLAIALIAGSIIGGIYLFESLIAKHDAAVAATQQQKENINAAAQAALLSQLAQDHAENVTRDAAQTALINSLVSTMVQQRTATMKQVSTDATLDAKTAAARLVIQTKSNPSDVTVSNDTVSMTLPLTRTVVTDLDLLPQAQSDVVNLQGQVDAQKILTNDAKVELDTATKVITADKLELISTIKADTASCDVRVDNQAKKDLKRGFWAALASFVGGVLIGNRL